MLQHLGGLVAARYLLCPAPYMSGRLSSTSLLLSRHPDADCEMSETDYFTYLRPCH